MKTKNSSVKMLASSVEASAASQEVVQTQSGPAASLVEANTVAGQEVTQTQSDSKVNLIVSVSAKLPRDLFFCSIYHCFHVPRALLEP